MKKILFLTLAIVCGVAFSDGWAKRPKKNQPAPELTAAERVSRKALREKNIAERLDSLKRELERQKQEDEINAELDSLKSLMRPSRPWRKPLVDSCFLESCDSYDYG